MLSVNKRTRKVDPIVVKSPKNRSVKFYTTQAYPDSPPKSPSVVENDENLIPLDKTDKDLQDHFVSLCDK